VTKPRGPQPEPEDVNSVPNAGSDGTTDEPEVRQVELTPGVPVSFEVPPNTNLVINVVGKQGGGFISSILSGCSCLVSGFIILAIVLAIVGSFSR
jgi:hypothetical protein